MFIVFYEILVIIENSRGFVFKFVEIVVFIG